MLGLRAKHSSALTADFRKEYNLSIWEVGTKYTYHEAALLVDNLLKRMDTQLASEVNEWEYPMTSEDAVLRDIFDLLVKINSDPKKPAPKPYRRPFEVETGGKKIVGSLLSWEEAQTAYEFSSSKSEEEIVSLNKKYVEQYGSLTQAEVK